MKTVLHGIIILLCVLFCTGCAQDADQNITQEKTQESENAEKVTLPVDDETEITVEKEEEAWGSAERISMTNHAGDLGNFFISLPYYNTIQRGGGHVAQQTDGTLVVVGSETIIDETVPQSLEDAFEVYKYSLCDCLDSFRSWSYENFDFISETYEMIEINGYEMIRHTGRHTFTYKDTPYEMGFIAYITQLKANNGYIFWSVIDESEEQNLSEIIASHAENMAKSLVEDTY